MQQNIKNILDSYQQQILLSDQNTVLIAGAGSGKTTTILGKINQLVEEKNIDPQKILVISFTNASVNDIKSKISHNVVVLTFHKLAMYILEKYNFNYKICSPKLLSYTIKETIKTCSIEERKLILKFLKLKTKFNQFLNSREFISFVNLIETFINLWKTNNFNFKNIPMHKYNSQEKKILLFIFKIYKTYINEKNSTGTLDFDDLIIYASKIASHTNIDFKYIIIDEFQDTSLIRLELIKAIHNKTKAKIIVVGDDWQSIYRFSGCDLNIFLQFSNFFTNTKTIKLLNTYRNSQELITITKTFIEKNPLQIKKQLLSNKHIKNPLIFAPYKNKILQFKKILNQLLLLTSDIMVLSRNNADIFSYIDSEFELTDNKLIYKNKTIKYYTVHKSKGLEAEFVVILNCNNAKLGFPNKIENPKIINKMFPNSEIAYSEERRLFYVALTRCKEQVFLLYDKNNPSIFIKEIKKITKRIIGTITYFK